MHTAQEALDAVAIARKSFERYSFDLIYARPEQTEAAWRAELARAISEATRSPKRGVRLRVRRGGPCGWALVGSGGARRMWVPEILTVDFRKF